jgi:hypothetical protein
MNWLENLWNNGQLGTVDTEVTIEKSSIVTTAIALVIVAVIIILTVKVSKKL